MASENQNKKSINWVAVSAISTVLTAVATIALLYPYVKSSEYKITATGEYFSFSIPNFFLEDIKKFKSSIDIGTLKKELIDKDNKGNSNTSTSKKSDSANEDKKTSDNSDMFWDFYKYIDEHYPSNSIEQVQRFNSYWEFSVMNIGSKEVTELTLEVPFDGYCAVNSVGEATAFSNFEKKIKLGSIRPTNNLKVQIWTREFPHRFNTENTRVTYPNGVIDVEYPAKVTGFLGWLSSIWPIITESFKILLILAIVNLPVQVVFYFLRKRSQNKKDKLREEISDSLEKVKEIIQARQDTLIEEPKKKKAPRKELID